MQSRSLKGRFVEAVNALEAWGVVSERELSLSRQPSVQVGD